MFCWSVHLTGVRVPWSRCVAVAVGHKVYSFGGYIITPKEDEDQIRVNIFNTLSLRWRTLPLVTAGRGERNPEVPRMRWRHTAVLVEDFVYIWGGICNRMDYCSELYAFDVANHRWLKPKVSGTVPEERGGHSGCVLGKLMYVCGGRRWGKYFDGLALYMLDINTMVWSLIMTRGIPPVLTGYSHIIGKKMFVFGVYIRVFDTETNCWLSTPSAGYSRGLPFAYNGELYSFCLGKEWNLCSLWKFKTETSTWKRVEFKGKGPCEMYNTKGCCMVGDRLIIISEIDLHVLELRPPSLKSLCKLAVIQHDLEQSGLPHNIRWELAAMTINSNRKERKPEAVLLREQVSTRSGKLL